MPKFGEGRPKLSVDRSTLKKMRRKSVIEDDQKVFQKNEPFGNYFFVSIEKSERTRLNGTFLDEFLVETDDEIKTVGLDEEEESAINNFGGRIDLVLFHGGEDTTSGFDISRVFLIVEGE